MAEAWDGHHHCKVCYESSLAKRSPLTEAQLANARAEASQRYYAGQERQCHREEDAYARHLQREEAEQKPALQVCVFAKSCSLPDGVIDHQDPRSSAALELLSAYGLWAIMGTANSITENGSVLQLLGGSTTGTALATRLGGQLSLALSAGVAAGATVGTLALLLPNTTSADSAFYSQEQIADLSTARTRAGLTIRQLPDGSVNAYGFLYGRKNRLGNGPGDQGQCPW